MRVGWEQLISVKDRVRTSWLSALGLNTFGACGSFTGNRLLSKPAPDSACCTVGEHRRTPSACSSSRACETQLQKEKTWLCGTWFCGREKSSMNLVKQAELMKLLITLAGLDISRFRLLTLPTPFKKLISCGHLRWPSYHNRSDLCCKEVGAGVGYEALGQLLLQSFSPGFVFENHDHWEVQSVCVRRGK